MRGVKSLNILVNAVAKNTQVFTAFVLGPALKAHLKNTNRLFNKDHNPKPPCTRTYFVRVGVYLC